MKIKRDQIRRIVGEDPQAIKAFEDLFRQFEEAEAGLSTGRVDLIPSTQSRKTGRIWYDESEHTMSIGMDGDETILQVGMEELYPIVENITGSTLENGTLVGFSGVNGFLKVAPFIADGSIDPEYIVGFMTETVPNQGHGYCSKFGYVRNINTTGTPVGEVWNKGDVLYASPTIAGKVTNVKPYPPDILIPVAVVIDVNETVGKILVRVLPQPRLYYGSFYDTSDQTTLADTPTPITFNSTHIASGLHIGTPTSRIYVENSGLYDFEFSLQYVSTSAALQTIYIWYRVNGIDSPNSASKITIRDNNTTLVPAWNFVQELAAGDYFELIWATSSANVSLEAVPAQVIPFVMPAIPSALLSAIQINQ